MKKRGVVLPGHKKVKGVIDRHKAKDCENQMDGCLPCKNCAANILQTRWRCKGTSETPPRPAQPRPGTPPAPPDDSEGSQRSEIEGVPPGYLYIHTPRPRTYFFNPDPYAKDRMRDNNSIPDLLTDEGPSTG